MKSEFRAILLFALILTVTGMVDLDPGQTGRSFLKIAAAAQWSEGILKEAVGLSGKSIRKNGNHQVEIRLLSGDILPVDSEARIRNANGQPISWDQITFPSKIRYRLQNGVVQELVLIEALPR
jgi:hypothetical protein